MTATLMGRLHDLVRAAQMGAGLLLIFSIPQLIRQLSKFHEWTSKHIPAGPFFWGGLIIIAVLFLIAWYPRRRGPIFLTNIAGVIFAIVAVLAGIVGAVALVVALVSALMWYISAAFTAGFLAYLTTWPVAIALVIIAGPPSASWEWLLPQVPVIRMGTAAAMRHYLGN
jgi:hypothetical protein